ncbi:hypothetical protein MRY87_10440 [bacterium]|nr:hypothetical protein [bacterium]
MNTQLLKTMNEQLLSLDRTYGADALAADFIQALRATLEQYTGETSQSALQSGLVEMYHLLLSSRPRMANLIDDLRKVLLHTKRDANFSLASIQAELQRLFERKRERRQESVAHAKSLLDQSHTILLHSYSSTLNILLKEIATSHPTDPPKIILAGQEPHKTERMIALLQKHDLPYRVVSEFAISHVLEEVDLALFGGLSLTNEMQLIMGPGSASLISQLEAAEIPRYVLLTTNKFSYWEENTAPSFTELREKKTPTATYMKQVFSHDVLPIAQLTGIISEKGVHTPTESQELFTTLRATFLQEEQEIAPLSSGAPQ